MSVAVEGLGLGHHPRFKSEHAVVSGRHRFETSSAHEATADPGGVVPSPRRPAAHDCRRRGHWWRRHWRPRLPPPLAQRTSPTPAYNEFSQVSDASKLAEAELPTVTDQESNAARIARVTLRQSWTPAPISDFCYRAGDALALRCHASLVPMTECAYRPKTQAHTFRRLVSGSIASAAASCSPFDDTLGLKSRVQLREPLREQRQAKIHGPVGHRSTLV